RAVRSRSPSESCSLLLCHREASRRPNLERSHRFGPATSGQYSFSAPSLVTPPIRRQELPTRGLYSIGYEKRNSLHSTKLILSDHHVDQPSRHDDDLGDLLAGCVGTDLGVGEHSRFHGGPVGPGRDVA